MWSELGGIEQAAAEILRLWAPRVGASLALLMLFWLASTALSRALLRAGRRAHMDNQVVALVGRSARLGVLAFGLVTALGTLGVDVGALVAGLGLTGFAVGFALRDSISNLISGVLLLLYRPFELGDHIELGSFKGTVVAIDMRYTTLEDQQRRVLVPNSRLFTEPIVVIEQAAGPSPGSS